MGLPIGCCFGGQQLTGVLDVLDLEEAGEIDLSPAVEIGQLGEPYLRKIVRPQTQEFPVLARHGAETEFVGQKLVFAHQRLIVVVIGKGLSVIKQACLAEKECFDLEQLVSVFAGGGERHERAPFLHGFSVDAKSESAGHRTEADSLPVAAGLVGNAGDALHLLLKALYAQGVEPLTHDEPWQAGNGSVAGRKMLLVKQSLIVGADMVGDAELYLRYRLA